MACNNCGHPKMQYLHGLRWWCPECGSLTTVLDTEAPRRLATLTRQRDALVPRTCHAPSCPVHNNDIDDDCTCGLTATLAEIAAEKNP